MRFSIDNATYEIAFRFPQTGGTAKNLTEAAIRTPGKDGVVISSASVTRYYRDTQNRDIGRKEALKKVLADKPKEFRTAAWSAYHNRPGGIHATAV